MVHIVTIMLYLTFLEKEDYSSEKCQTCLPQIKIPYYPRLYAYFSPHFSVGQLCTLFYVVVDANFLFQSLANVNILMEMAKTTSYQRN